MTKSKVNEHNNNMKIVSIEGLDKAGKHTATNILSDFFRNQGLKVERMSYPNYDSPIGDLIQGWLRGTFEADVKTFELLQAADKQHAQTLIREHESNGTDILLIDRYKHSMLAYGSYDNDPRWLRELTKYMRNPDVVLYLDVEPEVSMSRSGEHGENDYYESDVKRLRETAEAYKAVFKQDDGIPVMWVNANTPRLVVNQQLFQIAHRIYEEYTDKLIFDEGLNGYSGDFAKISEHIESDVKSESYLESISGENERESIIEAELERLSKDVDLGFSDLESDTSEISQYTDDLNALDGVGLEDSDSSRHTKTLL